ncbi:hypothetical protein BRADI_1g37178v3 [Brachypodium distachyon]|uniref:CCHC-type domain-containing protein n=1 Tax=Brachypodium distachyon TaxID=15368 RepID=A0A0Q3H4U2_BRADI|nr:hypothetical protein BRADI_1g37178v3 [Brachypodium distachyon]
MNGRKPCRPIFPIASAAPAASEREHRHRQCAGCRNLGRGPPPPQERGGRERTSPPSGRPPPRARRPIPPRMSAITKREFDELARHGGNYLAWATDVEIWLEGKQLLSPIGLGGKGAPAGTSAENAQALHFLRHHLCATLKIELKYSTQPQAQAEWARLRFADFRSVGEYNSSLHRICTRLQLCGVTVTDSQKIEKTLSTFHLDAVQSSRSYRQANYKEYSELIDILQVAEAHDEILKKNFVVQPLGASATPEVQANAFKIRKPLKKKRGKKARKDTKEAKVPKGPQMYFRCGGKSHYSRECCAPQYVADAYKERKAHEANLTIYGGGGSVAPQVAPPQMIPTLPSLAMLQASTTDTTTPMDVEPSGNPPCGLDLGDAAALFTMDDRKQHCA